MKALVLGGGGARGAWQVGVLRHLYLNEQNKYDIISGVSVGALNAAFLSMFDRGGELDAYRRLEMVWMGLKDDNIYKKWHWGLFGKLPAAWKPSTYNTEPLRDLVSMYLQLEIHGDHTLSIGAVERSSGEYISWNSKEHDFYEHLADYVMASAAVPGLFPPVQVHGCEFLDGGVRELAPVRDAVNLGATELDIVVPSVGIKESTPKNRTLKNVLRAVQIMMHEIDINDVNIPSLAGKKYRVFRPLSEIHEEPLDFDSLHIQENIRSGYVDASIIAAKTP